MVYVVEPHLVGTLLSPKCHLVPIVVQETTVAYQDSTLDSQWRLTMLNDDKHTYKA